MYGWIDGWMVCCDITRIGSRCSDRGILAQLYTHIDDGSDELCLRLVLCWFSASRVPHCVLLVQPAQQILPRRVSSSPSLVTSPASVGALLEWWYIAVRTYIHSSPGLPRHSSHGGRGEGVSTRAMYLPSYLICRIDYHHHAHIVSPSLLT